MVGKDRGGNAPVATKEKVMTIVEYMKSRGVTEQNGKLLQCFCKTTTKEVNMWYTEHPWATVIHIISHDGYQAILRAENFSIKGGVITYENVVKDGFWKKIIFIPNNFLLDT